MTWFEEISKEILKMHFDELKELVWKIDFEVYQNLTPEAKTRLDSVELTLINEEDDEGVD